MINPKNISACLITKDPTYPPEILRHVSTFPFGEILVLTNCESPHRKQELFQKAKHPFIYYQDDDCIASIADLVASTQFPDRITCAMKSHHLLLYADRRHCLMGWGSIFPKSAIEVLNFYRSEYGEDEIYRRETERIMTWFNYPQVRLDLPVYDLPSAWSPDRLCFQPAHYDYIAVVEERCARIEEKLQVTA